jgi:hypothetical protein
MNATLKLGHMLGVLLGPEPEPRIVVFPQVWGIKPPRVQPVLDARSILAVTRSRPGVDIFRVLWVHTNAWMPSGMFYVVDVTGRLLGTYLVEPEVN